jgi:hypothetical protein
MSGSRDVQWRPGDSRRLAPPIRLPVIRSPHLPVARARTVTRSSSSSSSSSLQRVSLWNNNKKLRGKKKKKINFNTTLTYSTPRRFSNLASWTALLRTKSSPNESLRFRNVLVKKLTFLGVSRVTRHANKNKNNRRTSNVYRSVG